MNASIKQAWVEALRSGKYKQGRHSLREGNCYCCLGVLTDLYAKKHNLKWEGRGPGRSQRCFLGCLATLPMAVVEWAGTASDNPSVADKQLTTLNDEGVSFEDIADLIEEAL